MHKLGLLAVSTALVAAPVLGISAPADAAILRHTGDSAILKHDAILKHAAILKHEAILKHAAILKHEAILKHDAILRIRGGSPTLGR